MNLKYFFSYADELPANVGFSLFDHVHLLWLFILTFFVIIFLIYFIKIEKKDQQKILNFLGWSLIFFEVIRLIFLQIIGFLSVYELPLHLCGLAGILCFLYCKTSWDWIGQMLYTACLPGTIFALLFPDWTMYPALNIITIHSFIFHTTIVVYCAAMIIGDFCRPSLKKIWEPILFLSLCIPPVYAFNAHFHSNYMFLKVPSAGSPLIWIAHLTENQWYLVGYAVFACFIMFCMNIVGVSSKYFIRQFHK